MKNLNHIVEDYIKHHRKNAEKELRWFAIQKSLKETVSLAALAQGPSRKRLSHQRRIPKSVLQKGKTKLLGNLSKMQNAKSFDNLHELIETIIGSIFGIGELMIYDTALRIGAKLKLEPTSVYLHAGTRSGAKKIGIYSSKKKAEIKYIPKPLRKLKAHEIEDVLCIYKNSFNTQWVSNQSYTTCYG